MTGRVVQRRMGRPQGQCCGRPAERCRTLPAKLRLGWVRKITLRTAPRERGSTFNAEPHPLGIVSLTARAAHGGALRHGDASGWGMDGQASRRTPLIDMQWMGCQYSTQGLVSSEKHEAPSVAGVEG